MTLKSAVESLFDCSKRRMGLAIPWRLPLCVNRPDEAVDSPLKCVGLERMLGKYLPIRYSLIGFNTGFQSQSLPKVIT